MNRPKLSDILASTGGGNIRDTWNATTAADPILRRVPEARRATLVAKADPDGSLTLRYRFDVVLQGTGETVFFDFKAPAR